MQRGMHGKTVVWQILEPLGMGSSLVFLECGVCGGMAWVKIRSRLGPPLGLTSS